ncbi:G-protein coupled receptor 2 [Mactra antiquata]
MEYYVTIVILLMFSTLVTSDYPPVYPSQHKQKKSFACENSYIHLSCKNDDERIRILRANYGRFSLVVCNEHGVNKGWNLQCSANSSIQIVTQQCEGKTKCTLRVNNEVFGDPCPDTYKYIEVQYYCEKVIEKTDPPTTIPTTKPTTEATSPPIVTTEAELTEKFTTIEVTTPSEPVGRYETKTEKQKAEKYCEGMEVEGLPWKETLAGILNESPCPGDMLGMAYWQCGQNGKWRGRPDMSECVSVWMNQVHDMMEDNAPADAVVTVLNDKMKDKTLGSGDLKKASISVIPGLVDKMIQQANTEMPEIEKREKIQSFTKNLVKSGSGLLNETQLKSWHSLDPMEQKKSATSLIVSLEQMALEVAATIDKPETVTTTEQNIVMEVSVIKISKTRQTIKLPMMQHNQGSDNGYHDFSLPLDAVSGLTTQDDVTVTYLFYNNLESLMDPQNVGTNTNFTNSSHVINSNIISASVSKRSGNPRKLNEKTMLSRPMNFTLSHKTSLKDKVAVCAYWKYDESTLLGEWSQDGCIVVESTDDYTTCQCNHLTNFAILMDVSGTKLNKYHRMSLQAITYVGCIVSVVCLLMCFISFTIFRNLQSDRNTIHKNLVLNLMIAELLFLFGIGQTEDQIVCSVIAGFLHYFFLASFSWMCLEGIQLYFMLIEVFEAERSRVRWFYAFGYGVPALIVGISAAINHEGYGSENHCWLKTDNYFILSFVVPVAVVVLINIVMLSIAIYMMCRHAGVTASSIQARKKGKLEKMGNGNSHDHSVVSDTSTDVDLPIWLKGSAVLVVLLGLTWTFGFLYINEDLIPVAYVFTILNSLQGLFIFIFHCFMDKKVKKEWRRAIYKAKWLPVCCRVNLGGYNGNLSSPTPTSSSGPQNYFMRFWSSRKRKRSTSSSCTGKNRRSDLDSFLRSDVSSGNTTGTGVNRYSNQSEKLLPNGQNVYTAMPTHYEGGIVGELSVVDGSVIDSEYVSEYCQNNLQVCKEEKMYSSGSDSEDECQKDNASHDSVSKNRLSFLSTDSNLKLNSDFASDTEGSKINILDVEEGRDSNVTDPVKTEKDRNMLNDLLSMYQNSNQKVGDGTNGKISSLQDILETKNECYTQNDKTITKSAPDLKYPTHAYTNQGLETSSSPLLGSLPDLSTIREEEESDPCSRSSNFTPKVES